jgi:glycosyltransferase involved in cell wall biosynthesis
MGLPSTPGSCYKSYMLVDVIIPTFNRAQILNRAVQSVLNQTYTEFILHIVDDGSTDNTDELLASYGCHPKIVIHKQANRGVSAARNLAVKNSHSPWISFLDSDDEWLPNKLEKQMAFLKLNTKCRFLHAEEIWIRNGVRVNPKVKHNKASVDLFKRSLEFCLISPSTVVMARDLFMEHGQFDESFTVCEDYDLWLKILAREEVGFLSDFVTNKYGGHEDQLSTKFVAMDYFRIKSLITLLKTNIDQDKKDLILMEIKKKAPILLKGYLKHQNLERHTEVSSWVEQLLG